MIIHRVKAPIGGVEAQLRVWFPHPRRIGWTFALCLVLLSQVADFGTFIRAASTMGVADEGNPVARLLYSGGGLVAVGIFKFALVAAAMAVAMSLLRRDRSRLIVILCAMIFALSGAASNLEVLAAYESSSALSSVNSLAALPLPL